MEKNGGTATTGKADGLIYTMAVDVQRDGIECEVTGWEELNPLICRYFRRGV